MKFEKEWLEDAMDGYGGDVKTVKISEEMYDQGRWDTSYEIVFQIVETGKYYSVNFSRGSTEMQDTATEFFNADGDGMVECPEVWKVPVVTMKWVTEMPLQGSCEGKTYLPIEASEYARLTEPTDI